MKIFLCVIIFHDYLYPYVFKVAGANVTKAIHLRFPYDRLFKTDYMTLFIVALNQKTLDGPLI